MFKLYDVVKSSKVISKLIPKDTIGTIVLIHEGFIPIAYEVEFINDDMKTISIATVQENDLTIHCS